MLMSICHVAPVLHHCTLLQRKGDTKRSLELHVLLASGADVNATDEGNRSALNVATYLNNAEIAKSLLDNRTDVDFAGNKEGMTALHLAVRKGHAVIT